MDKGERIMVVMTSNTVFPWQNAPQFEAEYRSGPRGAGDTLEVKLPHSGNCVEINMNSQKFVGIYPPDDYGEDPLSHVESLGSEEMHP